MAEKKTKKSTPRANLADLIADLSARMDALSSRVEAWESRDSVQTGKRKIRDYAERAESEFAQWKGSYGARFSAARPHFERVGTALRAACRALFVKPSA